MSELVKLIGAMTEQGWVYTDSAFKWISFTHTSGEIKNFTSWDGVAEFVKTISVG
jgi:hypothetical protein